jgi:uncharacterized protein YdiU (UPF0061 family)
MQNVKWNFNNSYAKLPEIFFTKQYPISVRAPKLIIFNKLLADSLGVPFEPEVFCGNAVPENAEPLAQAYAGHQFGHFTMLGDGRALLIGEQITSSGERFDIQLKGSGRTPYSRGGDGRAALSPMLREYIISEAMHAMGIPTTRSLAVSATGETVIREKNLSGAILTRVAASHIRVGTFEYAYYFGKKFGTEDRENTEDNVRSLADYTIERHFENMASFALFASSENKYLMMLREAVKRQAYLIAKWQSVGFIHGVMNTDNMAVSGETIDYGPCAFMDVYHPDTVFSSIDTQGRYAYGNQPKMAAWNLARFAETLLPILHDDEDEAANLANQEIENFFGLYKNHWLAEMRGKLGLYSISIEDSDENDELLINNLLGLMQKYQADYTNTFRALTLGKAYDNTEDMESESELFSSSDFQHWNHQWQDRLERHAQSRSESVKLMKSRNPAVIPRNHRVEEALEYAENGDLRMVDRLLHVLSNPYGYTVEQEEYSKLPAVNSGYQCYQTFCGT